MYCSTTGNERSFWPAIWVPSPKNLTPKPSMVPPSAVSVSSAAVPDDGAELQSLLPRLPEQQRDVGVVAGVENHVRLGALQLGDQRGKVGRGRRITFLQHQVEAGLLDAGLVALRHVDAVGAVLVNDGNPQILWLLAEFRFRILRDEVRRHHAVLVAGRLRAEDIFVALVVEHAAGN